LVLQPIFQNSGTSAGAPTTSLASFSADQRRIGREAHQAEKEKGPLKSSFGKKRAAHVVRVVSVPVVG